MTSFKYIILENYLNHSNLQGKICSSSFNLVINSKCIGILLCLLID